MKMWKKVGLVSALALSMFSLAACGKGSSADNGSTTAKATGQSTFKEPGKLDIYFFNEGKNVNKVVKKFESETKSTLNTQIKFHWTTDHKQEMPLKFAAKTPVDLTFDAYWQNLSKNISDGVYANLAKYFDNDKYPGLKKAFPKEVLDLVRQKNGAIYNIPLIATNGQAQGFIIDGKLRKKYNLPKVTDDKTFYQYLDTMYKHQKQEKLTSVLSLWGIGYQDYLNQTQEKLQNNIVTITGPDYDVQLSPDGKKVEGIIGIGDPDSDAKNFKAPYNGKNFKNERYEEIASKYGKFVDPAALSGESSGTSKTAGTFTYLTEWPSKRADAVAKGEDPELYIWQDQVRNQKGTMISEMTTANNFLCIPRYSKNIDRTMAFLNWIYSSPKNWDLWNYGIEGQDWEAVGKIEYKSHSPKDKYTFPTYEMTDNTTYTKIDSTLSPDVKKMYAYSLDNKNWKANPLAGFNFDSTSDPAVKQAFASYNTALGDVRGYFQTGLYGSKTKEKLDAFYKKSKKDSDVVKAAMKKQIQAFLDARNK